MNSPAGPDPDDDVATPHRRRRAPFARAPVPGSRQRGERDRRADADRRTAHAGREPSPNAQASARPRRRRSRRSHAMRTRALPQRRPRADEAATAGYAAVPVAAPTGPERAAATIAHGNQRAPRARQQRDESGAATPAGQAVRAGAPFSSAVPGLRQQQSRQPTTTAPRPSVMPPCRSSARPARISCPTAQAAACARLTTPISRSRT